MPEFIEKPKKVIANQWFPPGHEKHDPNMMSKEGRTLGKVHEWLKSELNPVYCVYLNYQECLLENSYWIVENPEELDQTCRYTLLRDDQFKKMYDPKP